jgi:enterochelin esterase-like enzyme
MRQRLAMLQVDPLNPRRCPTTFGAYGAESSYVELPGAQPIVWESTLDGIPRGRVEETSIHSTLLNTDKNLWVYTPPVSQKSASATHCSFCLTAIAM